jgi:hypothetical protein
MLHRGSIGPLSERETIDKPSLVGCGPNATDSEVAREGYCYSGEEHRSAARPQVTTGADLI